jgi:hypothetical protein
LLLRRSSFLAQPSERRAGRIRRSTSWDPPTLSYRIARLAVSAFVGLGTWKEVKRLENEASEIQLRNNVAPLATERIISQHDGRQSTRERVRKDKLVSCFTRTGSRLGGLCDSAGFDPMHRVRGSYGVVVPCLFIAERYFSNQQLVNKQAPRKKLERIGVKSSSR